MSNEDYYNLNLASLIIGSICTALVSIKIIRSRCCSTSECVLKNQKNNISNSIDGDV